MSAICYLSSSDDESDEEVPETSTNDDNVLKAATFSEPPNNQPTKDSPAGKKIADEASEPKVADGTNTDTPTTAKRSITIDDDLERSLKQMRPTNHLQNYDVSPSAGIIHSSKRRQQQGMLNELSISSKRHRYVNHKPQVSTISATTHEHTSNKTMAHIPPVGATTTSSQAPEIWLRMYHKTSRRNIFYNRADLRYGVYDLPTDRWVLLHNPGKWQRVHAPGDTPHYVNLDSPSEVVMQLPRHLPVLPSPVRSPKKQGGQATSMVSMATEQHKAVREKTSARRFQPFPAPRYIPSQDLPTPAGIYTPPRQYQTPEYYPHHRAMDSQNQGKHGSYLTPPPQYVTPVHHTKINSSTQKRQETMPSPQRSPLVYQGKPGGSFPSPQDGIPENVPSQLAAKDSLGNGVTRPPPQSIPVATHVNHHEKKEGPSPQLVQFKTLDNDDVKISPPPPGHRGTFPPPQYENPLFYGN